MKTLVNLFILCAAFYSTLLCQWEPINTPLGCRTYKCCSTDSKIFLITEFGLYYSDNNADEWNIVGEFKGLSDLYNIFAFDQTIFVYSNSNGIKYSTDNGVTWKSNTIGLPYNFGNLVGNNKYAFVTSVDNPSKIYSTKKSTTNWSNWQIIFTDTTTINSLFMIDTLLFKVAHYSTFEKSTDYGVTWQNIPIDQFSSGSILSMSGSLNYIYTGTENGIYLSTNQGVTWTRVLHNVFIWNLCANNNMVIAYVSNSYGYSFSYSSDYGQTWNSSEGVGIYDKACCDILLKNNYTFYASQASGVFRSADYSNTWYPSNNGLYSFDIYNIFSYNSLFVSTVSGTFKSTDFGNSWVYNTKNILGSNCIFNGKLFASDYYVSNIYYSSDDGYNWFTTSCTGGPFNCMQPTDNNLYLTGNGFLFSTNDGYTLTNITINPYSYINSVTSLNNNLFVARSDGNVYYSLDGINWLPRSNGLPKNSTYVKLMESNSSSLFVYVSCNNDSAGIYRSLDYGNTWTKIFDNHYQNEIIASDNYLFSISDQYNGGIFASVDNGDSWFSFNDGINLSNYYITTLIPYDSSLYAGLRRVNSSYNYFTNYTIIKRPTSDLYTAVEEDNSIQNYQYSLNQNYPNPFNPSTQIEFTMPSSELVNISVYNSLGQKIKILYNGIALQGRHKVTFEGNNLASGIYFYSLTTKNYRETKKMLLLR